MQTKAFLPPADLSLNKSERLCSKKAFELLFAQGKSVFSYPVKIIYVREITDMPPEVKAAFSVSKRYFKRAVKRNRIKRVLREVYRKHKLPPLNGAHQYLMILYISKDLLDFKEIEKGVIKALNQVPNLN